MLEESDAVMPSIRPVYPTRNQSATNPQSTRNQAQNLPVGVSGRRLVIRPPPKVATKRKERKKRKTERQKNRKTEREPIIKMISKHWIKLRPVFMEARAVR